MDMPAERFGRIHHLPSGRIAAGKHGMRDPGLTRDDGWSSEQGCVVKQRVESLTDGCRRMKALNRTSSMS